MQHAEVALMSSLTTSLTTTSIQTAKSKPASWLTMTPCRWPDPEKSIGKPYSSLDILGKHKCWSLCENGPAHLMWKELSRTIWSLLDDQIQHLDARGSELVFQIFMVGKQPAKTSPTIIFCSKNDNLRKKAMELVEKKIILGNHPGVLVAHSSRMPRPLALGDGISLLNLPDGVYAQGLLESGGIPVHIVVEGCAPRKATIGGFLFIQGEYYGLTTAHAFTDPASTTSSEDSESEPQFGFSGLGEPDDASDDDDSLLELTSKESVSSTSSDVYTSSTICEDDIAEKSLASTPNISGRDNGGQIAENEYTENLSSQALVSSADGGAADRPRGAFSERPMVMLGTLYSTSSVTTSLDWALVKIDVQNLISLTSDKDAKDADGWTENARRILNNEFWTKDSHKPQIPQISLASKAHDADVIVCTGLDEPFQGWLSAVSSFVVSTSASNGAKSQELWTVKLQNSSLVNGDCGSWVIDAKTGQVYGHIVSAWPAGDAVYLIPAHQVFQDIQKQIRKPVQFPKRQHARALPSLEQQVEDFHQLEVGESKSSLDKAPDEWEGIPQDRGKAKDKNEESRDATTSSIQYTEQSVSQNPIQAHNDAFQIPPALYPRDRITFAEPEVHTAGLSTVDSSRAFSPYQMPLTRKYWPNGTLDASSTWHTSTAAEPVDPSSIYIDESACLKKLTTYFVFTIRKCPPSDPIERATWARSEVIEERWPQEAIIEQIATLNQDSASVQEKKMALAQNQAAQITALLDDLASKEKDDAFEWSLLQLSSVQKQIRHPTTSKKRFSYETVKISAFVKRAPRTGVDPTFLVQLIEKVNPDKLTSFAHAQEPLERDQSELWHAVYNVVKEHHQKLPNKHHEDKDSSNSDIFDSDSDSLQSYGSDSFATSISSKARYSSQADSSTGTRQSYSRSRSRKRDNRLSDSDFSRLIGIAPPNLSLISPINNTNKNPIKSILKPPREKFPEDLAPIREGVAPLKGVKGGIPLNARWTKIRRKLVNPEALEAGNERFEARDDFVIVLRVLTRDEIQAYAEATQRIRAAREELEELEANERRRARRERHELEKRERLEYAKSSERGIDTLADEGDHDESKGQSLTLAKTAGMHDLSRQRMVSGRLDVDNQVTKRAPV